MQIRQVKAGVITLPSPAGNPVTSTRHWSPMVSKGWRAFQPGMVVIISMVRWHDRIASNCLSPIPVIRSPNRSPPRTMKLFMAPQETSRERDAPWGWGHLLWPYLPGGQPIGSSVCCWFQPHWDMHAMEKSFNSAKMYFLNHINIRDDRCHPLPLKLKQLFWSIWLVLITIC